MTKSPTACLNEVLLAAATRFERANQDRILELEARQLAKRNDAYAKEYNRVPATKSQERTHGKAAPEPLHRS